MGCHDGDEPASIDSFRKRWLDLLYRKRRENGVSEQDPKNQRQKPKNEGDTILSEDNHKIASQYARARHKREKTDAAPMVDEVSKEESRIRSDADKCERPKNNKGDDVQPCKAFC